MDIPISNVQDRLDANPQLLGLAIVISNDYQSSLNCRYPILNGTVRDGNTMAQSFEKLKYLVWRKHNVTSAYMLALLHKIGDGGVNFPASYKRIAFVFAGHGKSGGILVTNEGKEINVSLIIDKLSPSVKNQATTQLGAMARMFFIDACRGSKDDLGLTVIPRGAATSDRGGDLVEKIRISEQPSNILVAFPTVSGYKSYEVEGKGGIWLQCLAKKLLECDCTIGDVLIEVNQELQELWRDPNMRIMNPEMINRLCERISLIKEAKSVMSISSTTNTTIATVTTPSSCLPMSHTALTTNNSATGLDHVSTTLSDNGSRKSQCSSVRQKVPLAASFPTVEQEQHQEKPVVQVPKNSSCSNGQLSSCQLKIHPPVMMKKLPSALPTNHLQDSIQGRNAAVPKPGEFRGLLNHYKNKQIIKEYHFETVQHQCEQGSFRSTVTCSLTKGQTLTGDSVRYYTGKKGIAEEMAAKHVIAQINAQIEQSASVHSTAIEEPHVTAAVKVAPQRTTTTTPATDSGSMPASTVKIYKQNLHNLLVQKLKEAIPIYHTAARDEQGNYQCTISHRLFGSAITGNKFPSKKEAENSAAWRAWLMLEKYHHLLN